MTPPKKTLEQLRDCIAESLAQAVKSYEIPATCVRLGIQDAVQQGNVDEAHRSKRLYVRARLLDLKEPELVRVAKGALIEFEAPHLADLVSEMTVHSQRRITEITRRDVVKALNSLETLFGDVNLFQGLNIFATQKLEYAPDNALHSFFGESLSETIEQHYIRNADYSHEDVLIKCGVLQCSQTRFFALLEKLLDPVVRRGQDQTALANVINPVLRRDGFDLAPVASQSGYPVYRVRQLAGGVAGNVKNLIFGSIGEKPELIIRDAVNNDVEIVKHADKVLILDQPLPANGALLWQDLIPWWQELHSIAEPGKAKTHLYKRLMQSVRQSRSPGEFAIFDTYHRRYGPQFSERLPVLIPQVYLHYDPYTKRERGDEQYLVRQRMDFLLLLERGVRVVIEVDGRQHYADPDPGDSQIYRANPSLYASMVAEDRRLRLAGYEVYRFGGAEFKGMTPESSIVSEKAKQAVEQFFERLIKRHGIA